MAHCLARATGHRLIALAGDQVLKSHSVVSLLLLLLLAPTLASAATYVDTFGGTSTNTTTDSNMVYGNV